MENPGFESEAQVFSEPHTQMLFALRLEQVVKRTHLGTVVGSRTNGGWTSPAELAISGITEGP